MVTLRIQEREYELPEGVTTLGRSEEADIVIDSGKLSRIHCRITIDDEDAAIEDLDSKNGTLVDGKRISEKTPFDQNSKVALADLPCTFIFPEASTRPTPTPPASNKKPGRPDKAAAKVQAQERKEKELLIKVGIGAALLIVLIMGYAYFSGLEPAGMAAARRVIEETETGLEGLEVTDDLDANVDALASLDEWAAGLEDIPAELKRLYKQGRELGKDIEKLRAALKSKNRELTRTQEVKARIMAAIKDRSYMKLPSPLGMIPILEQLASEVPGTDEARAALEASAYIKQKTLTNQKAAVAAARLEAGQLAAAGKFSEALAAVNACLKRDFSLLTAEDWDELKPLVKKIPDQAEKAFQKIAAEIVPQARTGDCAELKKKLQQEADRIDVGNLAPILEKGLTEIEAVRADRVAQARKALAADLKNAEDLSAQRMYQQAIDLYAALLPRIEEPELKTELQNKQQPLTFLALAKKTIMAYVTAQQGLKIEGMGFLASVTDKEITLEIEGTSMPLGWAKLRDEEFMGLFIKALEADPDARGYAVYASMLAGRGKLKEADRYVAKALQTQPSIANEFPELFAASKARVEARKVEEARIAEEKRIAWEKAQLPRNHENRILRPIPEIKEPVLGNTPEADKILAGLQIFPKDSHWNTPVDKLPLLPNSDALAANLTNADFRARMRTEARPAPEFTFIIVPRNYPATPIIFDPYPGSCDKGDYPIPDNTPIEGDADQFTGTGDRHTAILDPYAMKIYELYHAYRLREGGWKGFGCIFDLSTNKLRRGGIRLTSSDAAGLPIFPALIRYDECERGMVEHAMRVAIPLTRNEYFYPATHSTTTGTSPDLPAMGERFRLKADFKIEGFSKHEKAVLKGLKKYGMFVADNGDSCAICAVKDDRLKLNGLYRLKVTDFEAVDTSSLPMPKK